VFNLIAIKGDLLGKNCFKQFPQLRDIPLFVPKVIDKLPHGLFGFYLEEFIKGTAGGDYPEISIQHQKGFTYGLYDTFEYLICPSRYHSALLPTSKLDFILFE
jgi:hypothetical protein